MKPILIYSFFFLLFFSGSVAVRAQSDTRQIDIGSDTVLRVRNLYGRIGITTLPAAVEGEAGQKGTLSLSSSQTISPDAVKMERTGRVLFIDIVPGTNSIRVDADVTVPVRTALKIETSDGEVRISGNISAADITTTTGTIAADVPTDDIHYDMSWTRSRPRFLSDFELEPVKERSGGRFSIRGKYSSIDGPVDKAGSKKEDNEAQAARVDLKFSTERGIVLINVPPGEVNSDLRERPLTDAAKAIIRSGDTLLTDAIRRASPKYFGDYSRTLPPLRREPTLTEGSLPKEMPEDSIKRAAVRVTDLQNRSIGGLTAADFEVTESGTGREVLKAVPTSAPVDLVLLLDVSGSVDSYITFIRKAARAFVETVDKRDRIAIVTFNVDVKVLSGFTTDHEKLSESLDTFDAGGGTAYYDALGYVLTDTLRPLRGRRTAIVVLSDGDDNRSFLPLGSLAGSIEESGALIYPLYVPSSLVARAASDPEAAIDPLRSKYMGTGVTSKANEEGKQLADISGGVYYPIRQLSQIQSAYEDIALQLRTAYDITFRSGFITPDGLPSPRLKIRCKRPNTFVQVRNVVKIDH